MKPMKVRKRLVHLARTVLLLTLLFMMASLIFLDILVEILFYRHWLSVPVLFVLSIMTALTIGFFVYPPNHVILELDGLHVDYPLGRERRFAYSSIKEYRIETMLQMVEVTPKEGKSLEFYYSDDELEEIKNVMEQNHVTLIKEERLEQNEK